MPRKRVSSVSVQNLNHLGIVASTIKQLGISDRVNSVLGEQDSRVTKFVTAGDCVSAMILNGLGFTNRTLYLVSSFFQNKPIDRLIRPGLEADHLNDDALGKLLDIIAENDPTKFFANIAFPITLTRRYRRPFAKLDSTNFSVEGKYDGIEPSSENTYTININHGHSKQKRHDLKQITLSMVNVGAASFPIWAEPLDGNSSDKKSFHKTIESVRAFQKKLGDESDFIWVADSALYSATELLKPSSDFLWITRVPETVKEAKELVSMPDSSLNWEQLDSNYKVSLHSSNYGGVEQRWFLFFSQNGYERENQTFEKSVKAEFEALSKAVKHLENEEFMCEKDAQNSVQVLSKKQKYHRLGFEIHQKFKHEGRGRPRKDSEPTSSFFQVSARVEKDQEAITLKRASKGRFILATNDLDKKNLSAATVLSEYKGLQNVERGFRFLKDPWFMLDHIFLNKPSRIAALMAVMSLCLFVYSIAEYEMRETLARTNTTLPNQLKKQVSNPTLRWVFSMLDGISIVTMTVGTYVQKEVSELSKLHQKIIQLFGKHATEIYAI